MNYQKTTPKAVCDIFSEHDVKFCDIYYYAWPQQFSSTSGPLGGWGWCALSTFTVEAWVCDGSGPTVFICGNMYFFDNSRFTPFKRIKNWVKLKEATS